MDLKYIFCVLGLVMIIEGLPYFIAPHRIKAWLLQIMEIPEGSLRVFGFAAMALGLFLVFLGRS